MKLSTNSKAKDGKDGPESKEQKVKLKWQEENDSRSRQKVVQEIKAQSIFLEALRVHSIFDHRFWRRRIHVLNPRIAKP